MRLIKNHIIPNNLVTLYRVIYKTFRMGLGKFVHCNSCGNEWLHYQGVGMNLAYWYCDKCGCPKEQELDSDISIPDINGICSCGGTFTMSDPDNEQIICSNCQSKALEVGSEVFNWD